MENENLDLEKDNNIEDVVEETTEETVSEEPKLSYQDVLKNQRYKQYALLAFIFAIVGYFCSCMCPLFGVVLAIAGLVFAIMAKDAKGKKHMLAIMAIIISVVAIITGVSGIIANLITVLFDDSFMEMYNEMMQEFENQMNAMEYETKNLY